MSNLCLIIMVFGVTLGITNLAYIISTVLSHNNLKNDFRFDMRKLRMYRAFGEDTTELEEEIARKYSKHYDKLKKLRLM